MAGLEIGGEDEEVVRLGGLKEALGGSSAEVIEEVTHQEIRG